MSTYDLFNGSSVDGAKWNKSGTTAASGGSFTITGTLIAGPSGTPSSIDTSGIQAINVGQEINSIVWAQSKIPVTSLSSNVLGMNYYHFFNDFNSPNIFVRNYDASTVDTGVAAGNTLREFRIDWLPDGSAKYYIDGVLKYTTTGGTYSTAQYLIAYVSDNATTIVGASVVVSLLSPITDTSTATESVTAIKKFIASVSETSTATESLVTTAPRSSWANQVKSSNSWSNQSKS